MDNIRPNLLKACHNELGTGSLEHIISLCFWSCNYPDQLKIAKVIPLFKKCEPHFTKNYRPISLLSILNKIIEKLVHNQFINVIINFYNNILSYTNFNSDSIRVIQLLQQMLKHLIIFEKKSQMEDLYWMHTLIYLKCLI